MGYLVDCPCPATVLGAIDNSNCAEKEIFAPYERVIFQRGTASPIDNTDITIAATWIDLFGLANNANEKAVITPRRQLILEPQAGAFVKNNTGNAQEQDQIIGYTRGTFTGNFTNLTSDQKAQIDVISCFDDIRVWFVDADGKIIGQYFSATQTIGYRVFPSTLGLNTLVKGGGANGRYFALNAFELVLDTKLWDRSKVYFETDFASDIEP